MSPRLDQFRMFPRVSLQAEIRIFLLLAPSPIAQRPLSSIVFVIRHPVLLDQRRVLVGAAGARRVRIDVDAMHVGAEGETVVSQHPPGLAFGRDFVVNRPARFQLQVLRVGRRARLLVYAPTQLVDRVARVESYLGVALVEVRVGQIED